MQTVREQGSRFRRASFGEPPATVDAWMGRGLSAAIEGLMAAPAGPERIAPPALGEKQPYDPERLVDAQTYWSTGW